MQDMEEQGSKWWYVSYCSRWGAYLGAVAAFPQYPQSNFMAIVCPLGPVQRAAFQRTGQRIMWSGAV